MRISDWSSDVCSSELRRNVMALRMFRLRRPQFPLTRTFRLDPVIAGDEAVNGRQDEQREQGSDQHPHHYDDPDGETRSEEHTSELQSLMRISYAVFCLKKKTK